MDKTKEQLLAALRVSAVVLSHKHSDYIPNTVYDAKNAFASALNVI